MFKKIGLSTLLLIGASIIGIGFASTALFPDTSEYPRYPAESGGIGYILRTYFGADGTAKNTEKLAGIPAKQYLHHNTCTDPNHVWMGIDPATGMPQCGMRGALLTMIGSFTEISGTAEVYHADASGWATLSVGDPIYVGDTVRTNSTSSGTIQFAADESILRLDRDTSVLLQTGDLGGNSVAEAILIDGSLWGRVMTSTGINLGGGGLVAGVRGTSVSVWKRSGQYTLTVIDSTATGEDAAKIYCKDASKDKTLVKEIGSYYQGSKVDGGNCPNSFGNKGTKSTIYTADAWIKKNTKKDLDYLKKNKDRSDRIRREYESTLPTDTDTASLESLCEDNQVYWKSLIGTTHEPCQSKGLVAFADFTQSADSVNHGLIGSGVVYPITIRNTPASPIYNTDLKGYTINATGKGISYTDPNLLSMLKGKKIRITMSSPIPPAIPGRMQYLASFSSSVYIINMVTGATPTPKWMCGFTECPESVFSNSGNQYTVVSSIVPSWFIIGNSSSYSGPINSTIQKIEIMN